MKVAVIGSGISGLAAAHRLKGHARVTLFEAGGYFGGHTHSVQVDLPDVHGRRVSHAVDTGFLVFNERTYPGLIALFQELGVATAPSDMSFSVQVPGAGPAGAHALEWSGSSLATVFAQRRNLLRPRFLGMLCELLRFNRLCTQLATRGDDAVLVQPLGDFLDLHGFSEAFRHWYFLPMLGCIWSCPTDQMLRFPVATMVRFCHNHGLLQVQDRPQWHTVAGGAHQYVARMLQGLDARLATPVERVRRDEASVYIHAAGETERFDAVVLAVHSDQALRMLEHPTVQEQAVLGAIHYQANRAILHTDTAVMPRHRAAWAAWNYERSTEGARESARVCLHYWLNRLQPLPFAQPVMVSLNPVRDIDPARVLGEFDYDHPVFDIGAMAAQRRLPQLQGVWRTWYAGAWAGYGFHEDGLQSGYRAADLLLARWRRREAA